MSGAAAQFISFEGGEGAGKSTQIKRLGARLRTLGHEVVMAREPGGTPDAEALRALVLGGAPGRWSPREEMLLMYAARSQLVRTVIKPALARGAWVLCDRFADSTLVYQGVAGGVPVSDVRALHRLVLGDFNPGMTFILDVEPGQGMQRVHSRAERLNQFEQREAQFYQDAREAYLRLAQEEPERCVVINADKAPDAVEAQILKAIKARTGVAL